MNQSATTLMEIIFNIAYLVVVWTLVVLMFRRQPQLPAETRRLRQFFILAFGLLALGDTGHVGFRVLAYLNGGIEAAGNGQLVGLGALSTAITVTFFYVVMLLIWKERFGKALGGFGLLLLTAAVVRLIIMVFPQNAWTSAVPPQPWSLLRNLPLMVQGFGVAYLILRDARAAQDRLFTSVGIMILVSYGFYLPVILFVQAVPPIGMLMIPKTLAYVAIAWLAFRALFQAPEPVAARSRS
ncbi:MAG TPA: hypothetical protein VHO69_06200 [Phototrophicaceae bacterium]|nr:hypothetical protein [Phototrophicaceae bacterium]